MNDAPRGCRRTACRQPATASLSYRYATGQAWLSDLSLVTDPSLYDLCDHHADSLTVPRGWERVDARTAPAAQRRPAELLARTAPAAERRPAELLAGPEPDRRPAEPATRRRERRNRYEGLSRELPHLAARLSAQPGHPARQPEPVPSRDLAPAAFVQTVARRRPA